VEAALEKARDALGAQDGDLLGQALEQLQGVTYQMTERLYAALGSGGAD